MTLKKLTQSYFALAFVYCAGVNFLRFPLTSVLKPLPILLLLIFVKRVAPSIRKSNYLFYALALCACGDVALTLSGETSFLIGLVFFLCAHLLYILLFVSRPRVTFLRVLICLAILVTSYMMFTVLAPHLAEMFIPVVIYMIVITLMALMALFGEANHPLAISGALMFLVSDIILSSQLFLSPSVALTVPIMVSYYLAQFLITSGVYRRVEKDLPA